MHMSTVAYRTCSLCEASCGLEVDVDDAGAPQRIRGDGDDVLSHGYLCPKGASLTQLHGDPDRLRGPLVRAPDGELEPASWDDAFAAVDALLTPLLRRHGRHAVGVYVGNPSGIDLSGVLYNRVLHKALRTRNLFTVATVDQQPKSLACALMYGSPAVIAAPDLARTDHLLVLGANPAVSNGSLIVAPDMRRRLRDVIDRGGKVVVFDPKRTRTAREASEHHFVRPGSDAALLAALAHVLFDEGLVTLGRLEAHVTGVEAVRHFAQPFTPERVTAACGVAPDEIRRVARELAGARRAAVYGRMGTTTQAFGTVASWLVDVLNVLTGNLDRVGGAMFGRPAADGPTAADTGHGPGVQTGRWTSRVRGLDEVLGELPVACLPEEITTPGEERVRGLITLAGNPALSNPDAPAVEAALASLDALICHDPYVNETTRHADVILPSTSPLQREHYPLTIYGYAVRNVAKWSPPSVAPDPDRPANWQLVLRLAAIVAGQGPDADVAAMDEDVARRALQRRVRDVDSPVAGRDVDELLAALSPRVGPARMVDLLLRCGPYGDGFGSRAGIGLADLEASPHGVDLGELEPRMPGILRTPSGRIELAPAVLVAEAERLDAVVEAADPRGLVLIGRRENRSLNSWLHNLPNMAGGPRRGTLQMHPGDAAQRGLADGAQVAVTSAAGSVAIALELTEDIMPGVVSAPHGWGHQRDRTRQHIAVADPGTNVNRLTDRQRLEPLSGTAVLNGVPVQVTPTEDPA